MKIFLDDSELEEIKPLINTEDRGIIISPQPRGEQRSDVVKEITALDSIDLGPKEAARINGVDVSSASRYANGEHVSPELRNSILDKKYNIQNLAITKLMDTLGVLDVRSMGKTRDKIAFVNTLSQVAERMETKDKNGDKPIVHLHMYAPHQKKEDDYEVIDA